MEVKNQTLTDQTVQTMTDFYLSLGLHPGYASNLDIQGAEANREGLRLDWQDKRNKGLSEDIVNDAYEELLAAENQIITVYSQKDRAFAKAQRRKVQSFQAVQNVRQAQARSIENGIEALRQRFK